MFLNNADQTLDTLVPWGHTTQGQGRPTTSLKQGKADIKSAEGRVAKNSVGKKESEGHAER